MIMSESLGCGAYSKSPIDDSRETKSLVFANPYKKRFYPLYSAFRAVEITFKCILN